MQVHTITELFITLRSLIRWGGILGVAYFTYLIIGDLADKDLIHVEAILNTIVNLSGTFYVSWSITAGALGYGYYERRFRRKNTKELTERINYLEKVIWPEKTTSHINIDGTTNMKDK